MPRGSVFVVGWALN